MAVMKGGYRETVGPSLRGLYYEYEREGQWIVSAMPPKRQRFYSAPQEKAKAMFKEACLAMKRMDPSILAYATEMAKGTPMLPRDYLLVCLMGRGPTFVLSDGTKRYSMAARVDLSQLFDMIAWKPGSVMYRAEDDLWRGVDPGVPGQVFTMLSTNLPGWADPLGTGYADGSMLVRVGDAWQEFPVGDPGYVLTVNNAGEAPEWQSPTSIGFGLHWVSGTVLTTSFSAFATKGVQWSPAIDCHLQYFILDHSTLADDVVEMRLVSMTGLTLIASVIATWTPAIIQDGARHVQKLECPSIFSLNAGTIYGLLYVVRNKATTYTAKVGVCASLSMSFPLDTVYGQLRAADVDPIAGDTLTRQATDPFRIMLALS